MAVSCIVCRRPYPEDATPYRCLHCYGLYDDEALPIFDPGRIEDDLPGIWRYRHTFDLPDAPVVSLGEGNTPLVWVDIRGRRVAFKAEHLNPTGSFKDRGTAVLISFLRSRGVDTAVEDSSGNAGASFAAYAARAGIRARVYVPAYASGPKRAQIEAYGAEVVPVDGPRSNAAAAVVEEAERGVTYASHAYLPFGLRGMATVAYELVEQLGRAPGAVIVPAGQGTLLLGMGRGFQALQRAGVIDALPQLVGVQVRACAPLWAVHHYGPGMLGWVQEGETLAEGVRIRHPLRGDAILALVEQSGGTFVAVDEDDILLGRDELARRGLYVEPTSAIVWAALHETLTDLPDPVVVILTGSGYKVRLD